ncbi:MAG: hypothetical protein ACRD5H_00200 [Nitrososphaerales archaeon]
MIEAILTCIGTVPPHMFTKIWGANGENIPWDEIQTLLAQKKYRCELHPVIHYWDGCE